MTERRDRLGILTRGRLSLLWDMAFRMLRFLERHARNATATFGLFLLAGGAIAVGFTWAFVKLAGRVVSGRTQRFDDAVMTFIAGHQYGALKAAMLEITMLGTGTVVLTMVLIAAAFLWLNQHKPSAILLGVATGGGILLNNLLKSGFDRPRPQVFEWGTQAMTSSFPSGHAMSAAIVYSTVAYLVARLQRRHATRVLTMTLAFVLVTLICISRLYLGVHYPSDVLAGVTIGLAWAGFCMATLEAIQLRARRSEPRRLEPERAGEGGAAAATPKSAA